MKLHLSLSFYIILALGGDTQISCDMKPQIREQMSGPDLYVLTVVFLALTKTGFSEKKNSCDMKQL